jgi:hypothetical protein
MKEILAAVICALAIPLTAPAQAPRANATTDNQTASANQELNTQAYIELLRTDVRKNKTQIMAQVMELNADQAAAFWPIYKDFEAELTQNGDQVVALVKKYVANYDNMSGGVADQLATTLLNIEQQRVELKRKYYARFKNALDPITAARFLQVENQLEKVMDLEIASQLPVISGGGR